MDATTRRGLADLAFGCFLFCGVVALGLVGSGAAVSANEEQARFWAVYVAWPLGLVSAAALAAGLIMTAIVRGPAPLLILAGVFVVNLGLAAGAFGAFGRAEMFDYAAVAASLVSGLLAIAFALVWFTRWRRTFPPDAALR